MSKVSSQLSLNAVTSVSATESNGVYVVECNITDMQGATYSTSYVTRSGDSYGLNPVIQKWLADNPNVTVNPYRPPAADQIREGMPSISARQLRLGMLNNGIPPSHVDSAIVSMPDGAAKEAALIEWEYATTFTREHPLIMTIAAAFNLSDEHLDQLWTSALDR